MQKPPKFEFSQKLSHLAGSVFSIPAPLASKDSIRIYIFLFYFTRPQFHQHTDSESNIATSLIQRTLTQPCSLLLLFRFFPFGKRQSTKTLRIIKTAVGEKMFLSFENFLARKTLP
jgi:hypothetical protein